MRQNIGKSRFCRGRMLKESYFDCYEYTLEKAKETIKNFDSDAHGFDAIGEPVVFENSIRQSYISDLISLVYSGNATDEELKQFNFYKEDWKKEYRKYAEEHGLDPEDTSSDVAEEHFDSWMSDVQVEREIVFNWGYDHEEDGDVVGFYIEGEAFNVWLELRDEEKECSKEQIDRFFRIFSNKLANLDRNSGGSPLIDINDLEESRRQICRGRMLKERFSKSGWCAPSVAELAKSMKDGVDWLVENGMGCCHWPIYRDEERGNIWSIVMGWSYDDDDDENVYSEDGYTIRVGIRYQSERNAMQSDYDIDFTIPETDDGDAYDISYSVKRNENFRKLASDMLAEGKSVVKGWV